MASPHLDEHLLLTRLHPDTALTPDGMRAVLGLCLLNCYDRKVHREFFYEMIDGVYKAFTLLKQLEICAMAEKADTKASPEEFSPLLRGMIQRLGSMRLSLYDKMKLVAECPLDTDTVS